VQAFVGSNHALNHAELGVAEMEINHVEKVENNVPEL
jgi:hypothetical protein